jgi:serine/threonine protein kinase
LAKRYRDPRTGLYIPYKDGKSLTGTARYASVNTHLGIEQSRRDDIEGLGYILVYFMRGNLPWQGLKVRSKEDRYKKILEKKKETSSQDLCKDFPHEFFEYVDYSKNLEYEENPDYDFLRQKFLDVLKGLNEEMDYIYDWTTKSDLKKRQNKKSRENSENEIEGDRENDGGNEQKDLESNNHDQLDRINTRNIKRNETQDIIRDRVAERGGERGEDKVESVCCLM